MALQIPHDLLLKLIRDPVMSAKALMGAEMDVFQAAALKTMWFVPRVLDHSGISTAKSERAFIFAFLRCFLIPPKPGRKRVLAVYYQNQGTAEETFLPKLEHYMHQSKFFEMQIKLQRGGKLYKNHKNVTVIEGVGPWRIELPAGDFMNDSRSNASRRFNDIIFDEIAEALTMGRGVEKQLRGRATAASYNSKHPVLRNHQVFLGHGEDPSHPYYKLVKEFRKAIRRGSQDHAIFCADYEDYRGEFAKTYGAEAAAEAKEQRNSLTEAEFDCIWRGHFKRATKGWYSTHVIENVRRTDLVPKLKRTEPVDDGTIISLGADFAPGRSGGSDFNCFVATAGTPVDRETLAPDADRTGIMEINGIPWYIRVIFAAFLHGKTIDQLAGVIHLLHRAFLFDTLTLDPMQGGADVYKKLVEPRQLIDNDWQNVIGLCTPGDSFLYPECQPLVHFFERGDPQLRDYMGERFLKDNSGPVSFLHGNLRMAMMKGELAVPAPMEERGASRILITPPQAEVIEAIKKAMDQFEGIGVKMDKRTKNPVRSQGGYRMFDAGGRKKDGAMATGYSWTGLMAEIKRRRLKPQKASSGIKIFE